MRTKQTARMSTQQRPTAPKGQMPANPQNVVVIVTVQWK